MKIYNKKGFFGGAALIGLVLLSMAGGYAGNQPDAGWMIMAAVTCIIGISSIIRSLSRELSREDKIDALDERSRFVDLKSKGRSFELMQHFLCFAGIALLAAGGLCKKDAFLAAGEGLTAAFMFSLFLEAVVFSYYNKKC